MNALDIDSLIHFLSGHKPQAILNLCRQPKALELQMLKAAQREDQELEPDSQEALEAAEADSEMLDWAEQTAGWLRWKDQQAWETLAQTAARVSEENLTMSDLDRINGAPIAYPEEEEIPEMWEEWEASANARF